MRIVAILAVAVTVVVLAVTGLSRRPAASEPADRAGESEAIAVTVTAPVRGSIEETLEVTGIIQSASRVNVGTKLPARIKSVHVTNGDTVSAGQVLIQLDAGDYTGQVRQAEAGLRAAQANLGRARTGLPLKTTESRVQISQAEENVSAAESNLRAAELGAKLDAQQADSDLQKAMSGLRSAQAGLAKAKKGAHPEEIARAESGVRQAEAGLDKAQRDFAVAEKLYQNGGLTRRDYEDARTGLRVAEEQLKEAQAGLRQARSGATLEDISLANEEVQRAESDVQLARETSADRKRVAQERVTGARTQLNQARKALELARAGTGQVDLTRQEVAAAQAAVEQASAGLSLARQQIAETRITAPVDGVVSGLSVHAGEMALPGQPMMVLTSNGSVHLEARLPLRDLGRVREGQQVRVQVDSLPGQDFPGRVSQVIRVAGEDNRSFTIHVLILGGQEQMTPGSFARATLRTAYQAEALLLPRVALAGIDERSQRGEVWVADNQKAMKRTVGLGLQNEERVEIRDGLSETDQVVITGQSSLREGIPVRVVRPQR